MHAANYQPGRQYSTADIDRLREGVRLLAGSVTSSEAIEYSVRAHMIAGSDPERVWDEGRREERQKAIYAEQQTAYAKGVMQAVLTAQMVETTFLPMMREELERETHPVRYFFIDLRDRWDSFWIRAQVRWWTWWWSR